MNNSNKESSEFLDAIHEEYGYNFADYSDDFIKRRIDNFMKSRNIESIVILKMALLKDESLFQKFIQEISVTVTEMFRDPLFFKSLRNHVLKRLATYPFIKIWVAGCATGEEAYSLAILFKEEGLLERTLIYATDINQKSIQIAKEGIYPLEYMEKHSLGYQKAGCKKLLSDYYLAKYNSVLFDQTLKKHIVFAHHNLAIDKSFNEFQLIICRNVLIYFNKKLQNSVFNLFYDSLCAFGFLGLGSSESLFSFEKRKNFDQIDRSENIYMKNQ